MCPIGGFFNFAIVVLNFLGGGNVGEIFGIEIPHLAYTSLTKSTHLKSFIRALSRWLKASSTIARLRLMFIFTTAPCVGKLVFLTQSYVLYRGFVNCIFIITLCYNF